jgi:hypothetical protein
VPTPRQCGAAATLQDRNGCLLAEVDDFDSYLWASLSMMELKRTAAHMMNLFAHEVHTRELKFVDVFFVLLVHGSSKVMKKLVKTTI